MIRFYAQQGKFAVHRMSSSDVFCRSTVSPGITARALRDAACGNRRLRVVNLRASVPKSVTGVSKRYRAPMRTSAQFRGVDQLCRSGSANGGTGATGKMDRKPQTLRPFCGENQPIPDAALVAYPFRYLSLFHRPLKCCCHVFGGRSREECLPAVAECTQSH